MIAAAMMVTLLLVAAGAIAATRPWASDDLEWFEVSALLEAALLAGSLLALA